MFDLRLWQIQSRLSRFKIPTLASFWSQDKVQGTLLGRQDTECLAPKYISDAITQYNPTRTLQLFDKSLLVIPKVGTNCYGGRAFAYVFLFLALCAFIVKCRWAPWEEGAICLIIIIIINNSSSCVNILVGTEIRSNSNNYAYMIQGSFNCTSTFVIYLINCTKCGKQYVGQSSNSLHQRLIAHMMDIRKHMDTSLAKHFNSTGHNVSHLKAMVICRTYRNLNSRLRHEEAWIKLLKSANPAGLNIMKWTPRHTAGRVTNNDRPTHERTIVRPIPK